MLSEEKLEEIRKLEIEQKNIALKIKNLKENSKLKYDESDLIGEESIINALRNLILYMCACRKHERRDGTIYISSNCAHKQKVNELMEEQIALSNNFIREVSPIINNFVFKLIELFPCVKNN